MSVGVLASLLAACTTPEEVLAPYAPPPATCEAIDREMEEVAGRIAELTSLDTGREITMAAILVAVAVEAVNPALALVPPLVSAIEIEVDPRKERLRFLASVKLQRECE